MTVRLAAIVLLCVSAGRPANSVQTLVGAWKLVSYTDTYEHTGKPYFPFGTHPKGEFLYTPDGHFSVDVESDPNGALPPDLPLPDFDDLKGPYLGYFGTYSFNPSDSSIAYNVAGSSAPAYVMSDVSRVVRFDRNRLILTGESVRKNGHRWSWERVLERDTAAR